MKKKKDILKKLDRHPLYIRQFWKINTLKMKSEKLEGIIKNELYTQFMNKINENLEIERLKKENKNLRKKIRELKKKGDIK